MFENLRQSIRDFASGGVPPAERAAMMAHMRATLVQAKVGIADIAAAVESTRAKLAAEVSDLETVRRRKSMALQIGDNETVTVATQFEQKHQGRVEVLTRKLAVQEDELNLAQSEVDTMIAELKAASAGVLTDGPAGPSNTDAESLSGENEDLQRDIDALARQRARESREQDAEQRLAELKRRMQK